MKPQPRDLFGGKVKQPRPKVSTFEDEFSLQCRQRRMPEFRRQHLWAVKLGRKFCADFAFLDFQVIVEIQGGIWRPGGGAHSRPGAIEGDIEKAQYAALLGLVWLPFTTNEVTNKHAVDWTMRVLHAHGWRP